MSILRFADSREKERVLRERAYTAELVGAPKRVLRAYVRACGLFDLN